MTAPTEVKVIDFRSDTFSLPTDGMRKAIHDAIVGDDVFSEDPTVNELEARCAKLIGKEAACYVPSGTMGNLTSILVHCKERGSEIIVGDASHINLCEQRGVSQFGGISVREIKNKEDGTFDLNELATYIRSRNSLHEPTTKLIAVESTHNFIGGRAVPLEWIDKLSAFAKERDLKLHLDGARIFNAALKLNVPVSRIARDFDSLTFCFSKGLGAPYGSIVLGTAEFIKQVRKVKKGLGGTSRQIGFMAAAGMYTLDHMEHLKSDHQHTQMIAQAIREVGNPYIIVPKSEDIHSNILILKLDTKKITSEKLAERLSTYSETDDPSLVTIKTLPLGTDVLRFVLCINNTTNDVEQAIVRIKHIVNEFK
ncbi:uncharacterized protein LOC135845122 [Planococcus citri]|uniref:uncharacterized protein LOC135845122 n=1 Tax=Planococcus citri TaxID=170843 RepID=UPI0031F9EE01